MPSRVLVLGGTGMIGNAVIGALSARGVDVQGTTRNVLALPEAERGRFVEFDVIVDDLERVVGDLGPGDVVLNGTGVIKQHIDDGNAAQRRNAITMNSLFPYELAAAAENGGFRVIHIATDCVFSGRTGGYLETSAHDAYDVYGESKSLGEVPSPSVLNLRCSMIGRELKTGASLLEWVLAHEPGSTFPGYLDHLWNGLTARTFGEIVAGIVQTGNPLAGTQHIVPADSVDKGRLSRMILDAFGVEGVTVDPIATGRPVDRTLGTANPAANDRLWADAGYDAAPTIQHMVTELAQGSKTDSLGR